MGMSRERVLELLALMKLKTVANGCTPGEAAKFAAKYAEWVERYQIDEAELRQSARSGSVEEELGVCENILKTGKRVFNPGMTQVVQGLALGMSCKVILLERRGEAVYGIIGEPLDANYVCQVAIAVVPALKTMGMLEAAEHGCEKAEAVRWLNQYMTGAGYEIMQRLERERNERSKAKEDEAKNKAGCTALAIITGDTLAKEKRDATEEMFKRLYPKTRKSRSRQRYNEEAFNSGREAGKRVGLNLAIQ